MPQILIVTESPDQSASSVVYSERVMLTDLESTHFSGQLVERVGWAVHDADQLEHRDELRLRARRSGAISGVPASPASPSDRGSQRLRVG